MKGEIISRSIQPGWRFSPFKIQITVTSPIEAIDFYVRAQLCPEIIVRAMELTEMKKKSKRGKPPLSGKIKEVYKNLIKCDPAKFDKRKLYQFFEDFNEEEDSDEELQDEMVESLNDSLAEEEKFYKEVTTHIEDTLNGAPLDDFIRFMQHERTD